MKRIIILLSLVFLIASGFSTGCGKLEIRIGSFPAPEQMLIARMIILMLNENGFDAIDAGTFEDPAEEVEKGKIDIFPGYSGYYRREADQIVDIHKKEEIVYKNIGMLKRAPADSEWAIVIPESFAESEKISNFTQFVEFANKKDGNIKLICSPDFVSEDRWGMEYLTDPEPDGYGLEPEKVKLTIAPSYNFIYMWTQIASPFNEINAGIAYTTGGKPEEYNLKLLRDDKGLQPPFNPVPLYNKTKLDKYKKQLNQILAPLFTSLDDETLIELNSQSGLLGKQAKSEVARNYLFENGYFKYSELEMVQKAMDEMIRVSNSNKGQITSSDNTSYMNAFPDANHKLYWDDNEPLPEYAKGKELLLLPLPWRETKGKYSCDNNGIVKQAEAGWDFESGNN